MFIGARWGCDPGLSHLTQLAVSRKEPVIASRLRRGNPVPHAPRFMCAALDYRVARAPRNGGKRGKGQMRLPWDMTSAA